MPTTHFSYRRLSPRQRVRERRRLKAARFFSQGLSQAEVARHCQVSRTAAHYWYRAWQQSGDAGLRAVPDGRPSSLSPTDWRKVERQLLKGPRAQGYATDLWTLPRIATLIKKNTGVAYRTESGVWKLLRSLHWSCQKPARRARERDERAIAHWQQVTWPAIQKRGSGPRPA